MAKWVIKTGTPVWAVPHSVPAADNWHFPALQDYLRLEAWLPFLKWLKKTKWAESYRVTVADWSFDFYRSWPVYDGVPLVFVPIYDDPEFAGFLVFPDKFQAI